MNVYYIKDGHISIALKIESKERKLMGWEKDIHQWRRSILKYII